MGPQKTTGASPDRLGSMETGTDTEELNTCDSLSEPDKSMSGHDKARSTEPADDAHGHDAEEVKVRAEEDIAAAVFDIVDLNGDGVIDRAEWKVATQPAKEKDEISSDARRDNGQRRS